MTVRTLTSAPCTARLLGRAALPLVPGASRLPCVPGRGDEIPELELALAGVRVDHRRLADYAHVCGFTLRDSLPATYLHVCAFPLHLTLMTDGAFPFPAIGLVHLANRITVHRSATLREAFDLHVHATRLAPHPKGRAFTIVTRASVGGDEIWEGRSTMLRRGDGGPGGAGERAEAKPADGDPGTQAQWRLAADLGRRYASVSGDRNPIHLHAATARLFGFPRAIAHGMWTKAACLAALEPHLPDAYTVDVTFRRPIPLPSRVVFSAREEPDGTTRFAVRSAKDPDVTHLEGTVTR